MQRNDGKAFEREFEAFMVELGWRTENREFVKGKTSRRKYECDIHGVRLSRPRAGLALMFTLLSIAAIVARFRPEVYDDIGIDVAPYMPALSLIVLFTLLLALLLWQHCKIHVWVECKDRRESIKRADVEWLVSRVKDTGKHAVAVRNDPRNIPPSIRFGVWKANQAWYVTSGKYDSDALNHADAAGVLCFQRVDGEFVRIR